VCVDPKEQNELGFNPAARDPTSYKGVHYSMTLAAVNNGGVIVDDDKVDPISNPARSVLVGKKLPGQALKAAAEIACYESPTAEAVFNHAYHDLDCILKGQSRPQPRKDMQRCIYTKDAASSKFNGLNFYPRLDKQLAAILAPLKEGASAAGTQESPDAQHQSGIDAAASSDDEREEAGLLRAYLKDAFLKDRKQKRLHFLRARLLRAGKLRTQHSDIDLADAKINKKLSDLSDQGEAVLHPCYLNESRIQRRMLDNLSRIPFEGVQSSYVYIKENFQFFNLHIEQMLFSFNHHQLEGQSLWIIVPFDQLGKLYKVGAKLYEKLYKPEGLSEAQLLTMGRALVLSKQLFLSPKFLEEHGILHKQVLLNAGDSLSSHGGCAHFGFSTRPGKTVSVATNTCTDLWLKQGLEYLVEHFTFVADLKKLWNNRHSTARPTSWKLESPSKLKAKDQSDQLKSIQQIINKAINNCPPNFVCAFLRGLWADLNLLRSEEKDARDLTVCSYPALTSNNNYKSEIEKFCRQILLVIGWLHNSQDFLDEMDDDCAVCKEEKEAAKAKATKSNKKSAKKRGHNRSGGQDSSSRDGHASINASSMTSAASAAVAAPPAEPEHTCMVCDCIPAPDGGVDPELWTEEPDEIRQQIANLTDDVADFKLPAIDDTSSASAVTVDSSATALHYRCIVDACKDRFSSLEASLQHVTKTHGLGDGLAAMEIDI
jgi:hypothetical protein